MNQNTTTMFPRLQRIAKETLSKLYDYWMCRCSLSPSLQNEKFKKLKQLDAGRCLTNDKHFL